MSSNYGYFDDLAREYVITNPRTPVKWVNYIGSLDFGGIVDQTGGSLLCAGDPGLNRITKYIPQLPASDFKGTTLYLRVRGENGKMEILSPFFTPALEPMESYECRVGLSYQRIISKTAGIEVDTTIFVPPGRPVEVRDIKVRNLRECPVRIDVVPVVEYSHFDALKQFANADWVPQTMMSEKLPLGQGRDAILQYAFMRQNAEVNFLSSSLPIHSFETDRKRFLGDNEYGTWRKPLSLLGESLSCYQARRGDNIGALLLELGNLAAGEMARCSVFLGQARRSDLAPLVSGLSAPGAIDAEFARLSAFWEEKLSVHQCRTPDPDFDSMVNIHNPRQCYMTLNWSRYLSLYQLGIGTRGLGFRDSSQDAMGAMPASPDQSRELIKKLLSIQNPDGSAMHQFYPRTMQADCGDAAEEPEKGKLVYGDDHLWIVAAVTAYLKETGDLAFLEEEITYYRGDVPVIEREKGTVLDHLRRALAYTKSHVGRHGLPLLGYADWNDTVNLPGEAESMFNACLYGYALLEMEALCRHLGDEMSAQIYRGDHASMRQLFNLHAWDGEWYRRYFTEDGKPLGSKSNRHGSIYTNAQSWPVLAGFAPEARALSALDSVGRYLNTRHGIKLSGPGFDGYDPEIGGITTYPPGAKENGGIFLHANPWVMIAETMLGRGENAYRYYNQINPAKRNNDIDLFEVEPYCYPQNILGDEHPQFGLGRNSWLSGTASWTYQAATRHLLGLRPEYDGLRVDPCVPSSWNEFSMERRFRGALYRITVLNPEGVHRGVVSVLFDGIPLDGNLLPLAGEGTTHDVRIVLGSSEDPGTSRLERELALAE